MTRSNHNYCRHCGRPIQQIPIGRPRHYCDNACKQAAYRSNKAYTKGIQKIKSIPLTMEANQ